METQSKTRAGQTQVPPEGVLEDLEPRPPVDMDEDLELATLLGDGEVPTVGGDRPEVRATTSVYPETSQWCRNGSPPWNQLWNLCGHSSLLVNPKPNSASVSISTLESTIPTLAYASDTIPTD